MDLQTDQLVQQIVEWVQEKLASNIEIIDISDKASYADRLVICTGSADLHVRAIAEHVVANAKQNHIHLIGKEGIENATWILIDFADVILHVFQEDTRKYYNLEDLWRQREAHFTRIEST